MSVAELITLLKTLPPDAVVLYRCCSDWSELDADRIELVRAEDKRIILREANGYSDYDARWAPPDMVPDFQTAVLFPGN